MSDAHAAATPPILTRDARPAEHAAVRALTLAAYAEYRTTMEPGAWAALEQAVLTGLAAAGPVDRIVAERAGSLVGSVLLYAPAADAYGGAVAGGAGPEVRLLAVPPEWRGFGVARVLMEECVRRARAIGAPELGLHTSRSMTAAIALYTRMGFERVPERDFQPPGAERVTGYRLVLDPA